MQLPALSAIKSVISVSVFTFALLLCTQTSFAAGSYDFNAQSGLDELAGQTGYDLKNTSPEPILNRVLNILFSILGIAFLALIVYSGILWMTDNGNAKTVGKAKIVITQAVTGLVIIIAAYAVTSFIFKYLRNGELNPQNSVIDTATSSQQ